MGNIIGTTAFVHYYYDDHNLTCIRKLHSLMNKNSPSEHVKEKKEHVEKNQKKPTNNANQQKKITTKHNNTTTHTTPPRTGSVICQ